MMNKSKEGFEIKIRAWDSNGIYNNDIPTMIYDVFSHSCSWRILRGNDFIKMLYIGLEAHGKRIFVGDILLCNKQFKNIVKFGKYTDSRDDHDLIAFGFYLFDGENEWGIASYSDNKIIGNIYDNPNMMEVD